MIRLGITVTIVIIIPIDIDIMTTITITTTLTISIPISFAISISISGFEHPLECSEVFWCIHIREPGAFIFSIRKFSERLAESAAVTSTGESFRQNIKGVAV